MASRPAILSGRSLCPLTLVPAKDGCSQTIWVLLSMTALGVCSYEVFILTQRYLKAPTTTKITYH